MEYYTATKEENCCQEKACKSNVTLNKCSHVNPNSKNLSTVIDVRTELTLVRSATDCTERLPGD